MGASSIADFSILWCLWLKQGVIYVGGSWEYSLLIWEFLLCSKTIFSSLGMKETSLKIVCITKAENKVFLSKKFLKQMQKNKEGMKENKKLHYLNTIESRAKADTLFSYNGWINKSGAIAEQSWAPIVLTSGPRFETRLGTFFSELKKNVFQEFNGGLSWSHIVYFNTW